MTLLLVPAMLLPTVTTANSPGFVSRATIVCRRKTMEAASTTGSTPRCGMEPCEPLPKTVTRMLSPADMTGPTVVPTVPVSRPRTCCAKATSGRGIRSARPSASIPLAPDAVSSAGWKSATTVPLQTFRRCASSSAAPRREVTWTSCPHACETPTVAPLSSVAVCVDAYGTPLSSVTGKASMSARHRTVCPGPFASTPTTPPPTCWTS